MKSLQLSVSDLHECIICDEVVKLLGIDIDFILSFDSHISNICKKQHSN